MTFLVSQPWNEMVGDDDNDAMKLEVWDNAGAGARFGVETGHKRSVHDFLRLKILMLGLGTGHNAAGVLWTGWKYCTVLPHRNELYTGRSFCFQIQIENITLHLIEDRPSPNITSPGSVPIDLSIPSLTITRDKSGLFSIQPSGEECFVFHVINLTLPSFRD